MSEADIDTLVAPIALYPDPLISQILPAATYLDGRGSEARSEPRALASGWLNWQRHFVTDPELAQSPNNPNGIDAQDWDLSVKAVAHCPQAIEKMSGDMDWTLALGQAYTWQHALGAGAETGVLVDESPMVVAVV